MKQCRVIIKDEVNIKLEGLDIDTRRDIANKFTYMLPYARHVPSFKLGRWDGKKSFFSIGGSGYINQLDTILPIIEQHKYNINLLDQRQLFDIDFQHIDENYWASRGKVWPKDHQQADKPIVLRDYQYNVINLFLDNIQSIQDVSTGSGKCLDYHTFLDIVVGSDSPVSSMFNSSILSIQIGKLFDVAEQYKQHTFQHEECVDVSDMMLSVNTPNGYCKINHFVKKYNTPSLHITFENGIDVTCAEKHIFMSNNEQVYADTLKPGDCIDGKIELIVNKICKISNKTLYDIGVDYPHVYYDSDGILHHNTITTATLAHLCEPYGRTITIVPSKSLVLQTERDFKTVDLDVGVYFGDRKEIGYTHTIATWQSINVLFEKSNKDQLMVFKEFAENINTVICDECHASKANILHTILTKLFNHCPIRWGLTGTIPKEEWDKMSLLCGIGPVINRVSAKELQDKNVLAKLHINIIQTQDVQKFPSFHEEYKFLVTDKHRLTWLAEKIVSIAETGNTLVLVNRIATGEELEQLIPESSFVSGAVSAQNRKNEYESIDVSDNKVLIASYGVASVGINIVRVFNLVLIEPGKSFIRVIQSIGRGIRKAEDKDHVMVYDITSNCRFARRHLNERKKFYKEQEYPFTVEKIKIL